VDDGERRVARAPGRVAEEDVEVLFRDASDVQRRIVRALRALVRRAAPGADESILWGALSYHRPEVGGRIKGAVGLIELAGDGVRLGFVHGARLRDPARLLEGEGVSKRFVRVDSLADVERPELGQLVREAAAIEWE
jgi:hypothetical protein